MEKINISTILYDSVVDGPGLRTVVFFQGCEHKCLGCHNKNSWSKDPNKMLHITNVINDIKEHVSSKKVTLSGGDPFLQKEGLLQLCQKLKEDNFHICVYTGYTYAKLREDVISNEVLYNIDILVDGKFEKEKIDKTNSYIGSTNQKIYHLKNGKIIKREQTIKEMNEIRK